MGKASPSPCKLYRYRTAALVGPWRTRPEDACADAVKARQASHEDGADFSWRVNGTIEDGIAPHQPRDLDCSLRVEEPQSRVLSGGPANRPPRPAT